MQGIIFALLTAVFWGIAPIVEKISLGKTEPLTAMSIRSVSVATFLLAFFLLSGKTTTLKEVSMSTYLFIIAGGVLGAILGQFTYFMALKTGPVSQIVPISASYPLVATILSVILLGETLTWSRVVGIILVFAGILFLRR